MEVEMFVVGWRDWVEIDLSLWGTETEGAPNTEEAAGAERERRMEADPPAVWTRSPVVPSHQAQV